MAPETFFVQMGYQYYGSGPWGGQDPRCGAYLPVIYALRDSLTLLHVQDYNSGSIMGLDNQYHSMGGSDFHIAMTDMLLTGFPVAGDTTRMFPALRPDQVAIGLPASTQAGNGWTSPAEVTKTLDCLTKKANCGAYQTHGSLAGAARPDDLVHQLGPVQRGRVLQELRRIPVELTTRSAPHRQTLASTSRGQW